MCCRSIYYIFQENKFLINDKEKKPKRWFLQAQNPRDQDYILQHVEIKLRIMKNQSKLK